MPPYLMNKDEISNPTKIKINDQIFIQVSQPSINRNVQTLINEALNGLWDDDLNMIESIDIKINGMSLEKFKKMIKVKRIY